MSCPSRQHGHMVKDTEGTWFAKVKDMEIKVGQDRESYDLVVFKIQDKFAAMVLQQM